MLSAGTHAGFVLGDRVVLFRVEAGRQKDAVSFELPEGQGSYRCIVTGLAEGEWRLESAAVTGVGGERRRAFAAGPGQRTLSFS